MRFSFLSIFICFLFRSITCIQAFFFFFICLPFSLNTCIFFSLFLFYVHMDLIPSTTRILCHSFFIFCYSQIQKKHSSDFFNFQEGPDDSWNIPPNVINTYCYIMWVKSKIHLKGKKNTFFEKKSTQVNLHPAQAACRGGPRSKRGRAWRRSLQPKVCQPEIILHF